MRTLVAYASKNGSTAEIAAAITDELRLHVLEADCLEAGVEGRPGATRQSNKAGLR
jgi:menaquinone-dependent protoporphyrinogen IX oxidase